MSRPKKTSERELEKQILGYFLRNSHAADDLEGVVRWRLPDEALRQTVEDVSGALDWLVSQNYMVKIVRTGSPSTYRLTEEMRPQAETFIGTGKRPKREKV